MKILLNAISKNHIDSFLESKSHTLGLVAPSGFGKFTVAKYIASNILQTNNITNNPSVLIIKPNDKGDILIDDIRKVSAFIKLKASTSKSISRVVIIKNYEFITEDSQNLLLKPLEEPPNDVLIILCVNSTQNLLPTIKSRIYLINLIPPTGEQIKIYFQNDYPDAQINKTWLIAQDRLGLFWSIINDLDHPLLEQINFAKYFIKQNPYRRAIYINELLKNNSAEFLDALLLVAETGFKNSVQTDSKQAIFWHNLRKVSAQAIKELKLNSNSKLTLTKLLINL